MLPTHRAAAHKGLSPEEMPPPDRHAEGMEEGREISMVSGSEQSDLRHFSLQKINLSTQEGTTSKDRIKTHPFLIRLQSYPLELKGTLRS